MADTGAVLALLDAGEDHHGMLREIYDEQPGSWILPWAILPEVDYLVATHLGGKARAAFLRDLAAADRIHRKYRTLNLGLVDAAVIALAERLKASAIATLDVRHFGAVDIAGHPRLLPRDR